MSGVCGYNIIVDSVIIVLVEYVVDYPTDYAGLSGFGIAEDYDSADLLEVRGRAIAGSAAIVITLAVKGLQGLIQLVAYESAHSILWLDIWGRHIESKGHTLLLFHCNNIIIN